VPIGAAGFCIWNEGLAQKLCFRSMFSQAHAVRSDCPISPRPTLRGARAFGLALSATSSWYLVEEIWTVAHRHLAVGSKLVHCVGQFSCEPFEKFVAG
jgi:hypothetical protein